MTLTQIAAAVNNHTQELLLRSALNDRFMIALEVYFVGEIFSATCKSRALSDDSLNSQKFEGILRHITLFILDKSNVLYWDYSNILLKN